MTTCCCIRDAQCVTGPQSERDGVLNYIIWLVVLVAKTFRAVQIFSASVGDAITRFIIKGCPDTETLRRAHSLRQRRKKTGLSMCRNSRPCSTENRCPTINATYPKSF